MTRLLRDQDRRARRAAPLEILVRLARVLERVLLVDRNLHGAGADYVEQVAGDRVQVLTLGRIVVERRPGREQRALGLEDVDVEGLDLARGRAERHEVAERLDAVERGRERGLADAVIDDVAELAAGDLL